MLGKRVAWKYMLRCCLLYAYNYSSLSLCHHTKKKTTLWIHFHHRNFPFLRLFRFLYIFSRFSLCVYFRLGSLSLSSLFVACTTTSQLHWSERDSNTMWDLRFFFVYFLLYFLILFECFPRLLFYFSLSFSFNLQILMRFSIAKLTHEHCTLSKFGNFSHFVFSIDFPLNSAREIAFNFHDTADNSSS